MGLSVPCASGGFFVFSCSFICYFICYLIPNDSHVCSNFLYGYFLFGPIYFLHDGSNEWVYPGDCIVMMIVLSDHILVYDVEVVDENAGVELSYPYDIDGQ